ncbi:MAG: FKBP-type peptidyl-prolyl cis-trans isomerase N-terminal domain-containing protein [Serratia marcescens]|nr:FKBP-type peptidyl-prolyl cis-trans isomerase N-terminal domain-containing protein [Serratia marcescens]
MKHGVVNTQPHFLYPIVGVAIVAGMTFFSPAHAAPQAGVPALLQFAEQYQQERETDVAPKKAQPSAKSPVPLTDKPGKDSAKIPPRWQTKDTQIQRLQGTIRRLELEIVTLKNAQATQPLATQITAPTPVDLQPLSKLAQGLRQALSLTPEQAQLQKQLREMQQRVARADATEHDLRTENASLNNQLSTLKTQIHTATTEENSTLTTQLHRAEQDKATLQAHLADAQKDYQTLLTTAENDRAQLARAKDTETGLRNMQSQQQQQLDELKRQRTTLQTELDGKVAEIANQAAELTALRKTAPVKIDPDNLKKPAVRQDYAAGVSLGEEILQMHAERRRWGVNVDKQTLLAGLIDTFNGKQQLDDAALNKALEESEKRVTQARDITVSAQKKQGDAYLARFKKDKHVAQTPSGAWYRIDYAGDSHIPANATLDVVVKETLTDGTVIQDMEASGAVLSQTLSQFPPLFAEALHQLKNHGSLTLVVPPALAYGDKGYPPNVPPNATMVYTLRIAEVYPATQPKLTPTATATSR